MAKMGPPLDKSGWEHGPWMDEPDLKLWESGAGLVCLILRNSFGVLCGYVAVPKGSVLDRVHYDDERLHDIEVHGGLTFSGERSEWCETDHWWFGFDCGHGWDFMPGIEAMLPENLRTRNGEKGESYRDMDYVIKECEQLAEQLAVIVMGGTG